MASVTVPMSIGVMTAREELDCAAAAQHQGLTLVHSLAQRKHLLWDRGRSGGV